MPRQLIRHHRYFLLVFSLYVIAGAFSFLFYKQGSETLYMNGHHTSIRDYFFVFITHLVEGLSFLIITAVLSMCRIKYLLVFAINMLIVGVVIHFLKHQVFADHVRPSLYFDPSQKLNFVSGRPILRDYSFPSGHTASAFAVALMLAIFIRRTWASFVLLALALLVGLSRMYLLEHFWIDVYFGSLIGFSITLFVYIALQKTVIHSENSTLNFSLYERYFKRK